MYGVTMPKAVASWVISLTSPGWATEVSQSAYGHRARKRTWLYYVGEEPPPMLDWSEPAGSAYVSWGDMENYSHVERLGKAEALSTPLAFRDLLLGIARSVKPLQPPPPEGGEGE